MSISSMFQGFLRSCSRKRTAKVQSREQMPPPASPGGAVRDVKVWTSEVAPVRAGNGDGGPAPRASTQLLEAPPFLLDDQVGPIKYMADIPGEMRERIQQEGMARALRRLETPLRALYMATSRKGGTYPAEELRGFLLMWRQGLADYMGLVPDERSVIVYERSVDEAYFVRGRCEVGAHLTIIEPCWRLNGEVVVRGEAQVVQGWVR